MKILYLITGLNIGGAEKVLYDLIGSLNRERFEVVVVSIIPIGEIGEMMKKEGFRVLSLNARVKWNPFIFFRLLKILKKEKPDIVHTHLFHADFLGRVIGKLTKTSLITTIHNINIGGGFREFLMRTTRNFSDYNIAVSEVVAKKAIDKKMAGSNKLSVIYNGINLRDFHIKEKQETREKLNLPKDKAIFVSVGSLIGQKGYEYLIGAVKKIKREALFFILGEGAERKVLENQIKKNNLEDKVFLTGNVSNVNDYLQAADFFIIPSLWEGLSIALLEAAAAGKIIIATNVGGNSEVITNGENGFLIEPKNSQALAEKIEYVLNLPEEEKKRIKDNARKTVEEKFSIEKMVKEYEDLYKDLLKNK